MANLRRAGAEAQALGKAAEDTLGDLVKLWLPADARPPIVPNPDAQCVDLQILLPSLWGDVNDLVLDIQVKATGKRPIISEHNPLGVRALSTRFSKDTVKSLREASRRERPLYLAYAVQRDPSIRPNQLFDLVPVQRFDWYLLDLTQYFRRDGADQLQTSIPIPESNRLNLGLLSLLWASRWVENFYRPLRSIATGTRPELTEAMKGIFFGRGVSPEPARDWSFITDVLPRLADHYDRKAADEIVFRMGIGFALIMIRTKIQEVASNLSEIVAYCPESLYGTTNLWLFARPYHDFMRDAYLALHQGGSNRRYLPLPGERAEDVSPILRCSLAYAILRYRSMSADVTVVPKPTEDAGSDHSHYGGGIGYFPYVTLDEGSARWAIESETSGDRELHRDFVEQFDESSSVISPASHWTDMAQALGLSTHELELATSKPQCLFPPEDEFVLHPAELWDRRIINFFYGVQATIAKSQ